MKPVHPSLADNYLFFPSPCSLEMLLLPQRTVNGHTYRFTQTMLVVLLQPFLQDEVVFYTCL